MFEIGDGIAIHPVLGNLVGVPWITVIELDLSETVSAARLKAELGGDPTRDLGECAVIAAAQARGGVAVVDDRDAADLGRRHGVTVVGTLAVIASALKRNAIERTDAERLVDELAATDMRLPIVGDSFVAWSYEHGLLP
jgi:predicted nucleic acid-binding protein